MADSSEHLFRAAFAISLHECPETSWEHTSETIGKLVELVKSRSRSSSTPAILAHLHDVLFEIYGLTGNAEDYYKTTNSYLGEILRSRRGIPISLVLIYKWVGESCGLRVYGINSPGHFLAEVEGGELARGEKMYVDPFYGGTVLNKKEVAKRIAQTTGLVPSEPLSLQRATHQQWLSRMLVNLQASFAALGQERDVCAMQELQQLIEAKA